jgi:hypothetical protein
MDGIEDFRPTNGAWDTDNSTIAYRPSMPIPTLYLIPATPRLPPFDRVVRSIVSLATVQNRILPGSLGGACSATRRTDG